MKKSTNLRAVLREHANKMINEAFYDKAAVPGFELAVAYKSGDWSEIQDSLEQVLDDPKAVQQAINTLKKDLLVVQIDLDETNFSSDGDFDTEEYFDETIEQPNPIKKLARLSDELFRKYSGEGFKYFTLIPVDYNRGTNYINLALSSNKKLLQVIEGEY